MKYPPTENTANISEIFSSLQGEGPRVGERHLFIRFEECHIHCEYCDELDKKGQPMTMDQVMARVLELEATQGPHSFVSLTGGEPLLYIKFLKPLIEKLKAVGLRIYLETDGILWQSLEQVVGWCDVIAMDMKPSSVTKEKNFFEEHRRFLDISKSKDVFVKIVLSKEINVMEFKQLVEILSEIDSEIPLILQPISADIEGHEDVELMGLLERLQRSASKKVSKVQIVPRFHKILNIR